MSDNERIDWHLARADGRIRQVTRHFQRGSALRPDPLGEYRTGRSSIEDFNRSTAEHTRLLGTNRIEGLPMRMRPSLTEYMSQSMSHNHINAAAPAPEQQGPKKLVSTVVSVLPKTTYDESKQAEGTEISLAYINVQRSLLKWMGKHASDLLTPQQALKWTQSIAGDKRPQAKDALRLCYYMRSQAFDTYADVRGGSISLYVANQTAYTRGPQTDGLYWKQMIKTDEIVFMASSFDRPVQRNTLVPAPPNTIGGLLSHLAAPSRPRTTDATNEQNRGEGRDPPEDTRLIQDDFAALITDAQAYLDDLLASENPEPVAVEAAIMQIEEYGAQVYDG